MSEVDTTKAKAAAKAFVKHAERKRWEYINVQGGHQVNKMNELGEEGWDIVRVEQGHALFKREKID